MAAVMASNHSELRNCSLTRELDSAAEGTGLAFIVMAEVFVQVNCLSLTCSAVAWVPNPLFLPFSNPTQSCVTEKIRNIITNIFLSVAIQQRPPPIFSSTEYAPKSCMHFCSDKFDLYESLKFTLNFLPALLDYTGILHGP